MKAYLYISLGLVQFLGLAHAIALGPANIHSYYNEPLDVTIPIVLTDGETRAELHAALPNHLAFASAGLEKTELLSSVRINLRESDKNEHYLHLTTVKPVRELYLDFIMDVSTPSQRLSSNITLLVDPRNYTFKGARKAGLKKAAPRFVSGGINVSKKATPDKGKESHSMESHSMEATLDKGKESHSMESHSMEATLDKGKESHSMESHSMEAMLEKGKESHSMESHSMESHTR